eukprot:6180542-Pleurochrysis_carterae.AAC.1
MLERLLQTLNRDGAAREHMHRRLGHSAASQMKKSARVGSCQKRVVGQEGAFNVPYPTLALSRSSRLRRFSQSPLAHTLAFTRRTGSWCKQPSQGRRQTAAHASRLTRMQFTHVPLPLPQRKREHGLGRGGWMRRKCAETSSSAEA